MEREEARSLVGKKALVDGIEYRIADVRSGGMGVVYLLTRKTEGSIEPVVYKTKLAAKTFNGSDQPDVRAVIKRELKNWLSLRHKHIVELLAIGDFNFDIAALMPVAAASVAEQTIAKGPIPILAAVQIVREAVAGLSYAWTTGRLLHLDVKPENLLIMREDGHYVVKVSDWGMSSIQITSPQQKVWGGTPPYMAPERFCNGATQSCLWDIFSLGIALIAFVSGRLPFDFRQDVPEQLLSEAYLSNAAALLSGTELHASARRTVLYMVHPDSKQRIGNYDDLEEALGVIGRNPRFTFPWTKRQPWS